MKRLFFCLFTSILLTACASKGMLYPTPPVSSPETSANITIHRAIPHDTFFDNLVFTINEVDTYGFDHGSDFKFVLSEGNYIFGYKHGMFSDPCSVDVEIKAGMDYVFNLEPSCVIEME